MRSVGSTGWWDEECELCKKQFRDSIEEWKRGKIEKKEYKKGTGSTKGYSGGRGK